MFPPLARADWPPPMDGARDSWASSPPVGADSVAGKRLAAVTGGSTGRQLSRSPRASYPGLIAPGTVQGARSNALAPVLRSHEAARVLAMTTASTWREPERWTGV